MRFFQKFFRHDGLIDFRCFTPVTARLIVALLSECEYD